MSSSSFSSDFKRKNKKDNDSDLKDEVVRQPAVGYKFVNNKRAKAHYVVWFVFKRHPVGSQCDVLDSDTWRTARILKRKSDNSMVFVTFEGWSRAWDEWIPLKAGKIAPLWSKVGKGVFTGDPKASNIASTLHALSEGEILSPTARIQKIKNFEESDSEESDEESGSEG